MSKSTLVVMPTGTGKTVVMGTVARDWAHGRIMVIAHRKELIEQNADKIGRVCSETCGIDMADTGRDSAPSERIVVASVQTLNAMLDKKPRMERYDPMDFGLIMTDEAHHATAASYRRVYDWFLKNPTMRHLGVTATPDRADEEALGQIFESVAYDYEICDAIRDGWLVPIDQQFVHVQGLDLSQCKADRNDLKDADVARVMEQEELIHKVVDPVVEIAGDLPTMVFAASVAHAHKMAEIFNRHKSNSAVAIDGTTDKDERDHQLKRFARGEFQYLCNMGVFLEGFDEPRIGCVAVARPTKSRALYCQIVGRGTRPLPGLIEKPEYEAEERRERIAMSAKPSVLVLDFVGNSGRHKLVSTADILGGNESEVVIERAVQNVKDASQRGERKDMQQALIDARQQLEEEERLRRESEAKRAKIVAKSRFETKSVNPFDIFDMVPKREPGWFKGKMATERQKAVMAKFKVDQATIDKASFFQATTMIDKLIERAKKGYCSLKQAKLLGKYGYSTDVPFERASAIIDAVAKAGWKFVPENQIP